jgi:pimeloyl-ACP methyl ester carboxylesterase
MLKVQQQGSGPTLILVPGLDGTALFFFRQIPPLAQLFHVVTFPLPDAESMEVLVEELAQTIRRVAPGETVLLCGESFGGALSLSLALAQPELLRGMVILNSFSALNMKFRLRAAPPLLRAMPWGAMRMVRRFTESRLHTPHTRPEDLKEFHERARAIRREGYIRRLEILRRYDIRERLPEIQTPTLFLAGDRDRLVPSVTEARFMAARMPRASYRILQGYGHICLIHHDFNLLDHLLPWLDEMGLANFEFLNLHALRDQ